MSTQEFEDKNSARQETGSIKVSRFEQLLLMTALESVVQITAKHPMTPNQEKTQKARVKLLSRLQTFYADRTEGDYKNV